MRDAASEVYGLGERAMARASDPDTSHDATASLSEEALTDSQHAVLIALEYRGPMADHEIVAHVRDDQGGGRSYLSESRLRTARCELVRKGLVRDSGRRERTPSGRQSIVWELVR